MDTLMEFSIQGDIFFFYDTLSDEEKETVRKCMREKYKGHIVANPKIDEFLEGEEDDSFVVESEESSDDALGKISLEELEKEALSFKPEEEIDEVETWRERKDEQIQQNNSTHEVL